MSEEPVVGSGRRSSFVRAAVGTFGTNVAVAILSLVNVLIVARVVGVEGRGEVAFLIAVATLGAYFGAGGVQDANANIGGSEPELRPALAANSLMFAGMLGGLVSLLLAVLVLLVPAAGGDGSRTLVWVTLGVIPVVILRNYLGFLIQSDYHFLITNLAWLAGPMTTALTNGTLAISGHLNVTTAISAWIAGQLLGTGLLIWFVATRFGIGRPDARLARRTIAFGSKAQIGHVLEIGNYRMDQWFIGVFAGSRELGLYSVAVAWAEVLFYLPGVLVMIQRPDLVRAVRAEAARQAERLARATLLLAIPLAGVLIVAAPVLCKTVFGAEFAGSVDDLRVLALSAAGITLMAVLGSALTAQRRPLLTTSADACAFVLTLSLNIALIPSFGGLGAAVATATAWTGGGVAMAIIFSRAMGSDIRRLVPGRRDVMWMRDQMMARARARRL